MRIKAGNQLTEDANVLDLGTGWSLTEVDKHVTVSNGGSLPAITISPVAYGNTGVTIKDDSGNTLLRFLNDSLDSGHYASGLVYYGSNGLGPGGEAWYAEMDVAATTPYRDFVIGKVLANGSASDPDGIYISNGGSGPATIGMGVSQPGDSGRAVRVKVSGGTTTQGGLQILQATTNTTVPPFSITDAGAVDRVWVDPASANNWRLRIAGDTTAASVVLGVQDITTPTTVTFAVAANGNVTIANPGANIAQIQFGNTAQNAQLKVLAAGELTIGNSSAGALITLGNHATSWTALGFFGAAAVVKPTVTGSKGANAALASLLTALSGLGLVTDSTT